MKMMNSALDSLVNAFADATEETLIPQCLFAQALMLTSEAYMGLDRLPLAEAANEVALKISRCLPLEERLNILLVTVDLSKRTNDIPKLLAARHHIYDLIKAEEKDPYVVAQVSLFLVRVVAPPQKRENVTAPGACGVLAHRYEVWGGGPRHGFVRRRCADVADAGI